MRFDGYAGTIRTDRPFDEVAQVFAHDLGAVIARGKAMKRYGEVLRVEHAGHCAVWVGRDHGNGSIYFEGKGESTPELVASVRKRFEHGVARGDVCEDYDAEGAFERLQAIVRVAKGPRVKAGYVHLSDDPHDGRTWASGVRGSNYVRLYEAGKMADRLHYGKPNWARLELEARPHYAADKLAAARMSPLEFWGLSAWTQRVAEAVTQVDVPRYLVERDKPTHDKTRRYLATTFRRFWEECFADGQDWTCIGRDFEEIWRQDDELAEVLRNRGSDAPR